MKQTNKTALQCKKLLALIILGLAGALSPNYPILVICGLVFVLALEFSLPVDYRFIIKKSLFFENKSLSTEKTPPVANGGSIYTSFIFPLSLFLIIGSSSL